MFRHIWVAYEDEPAARAALTLAVDLAGQTGAQLTIAHVAPPSDPDDEPLSARDAIAVELLGAVPAVRRRGALVAAAASVAGGVPIDVRVWSGRVPDELLVNVRREQPDLVVTGTRGATGVRRLLQGPSVSGALIRDAGCPVLVVRQGCTRPRRIA